MPEADDVKPPRLPGKKGEKGDKGNQGNPGVEGVAGPKGPTGASGSNLEILEALGGLGNKVDHLDGNVRDERAARLEEKKSRDNQAKWFKRFLAVGFAFILISSAAAIESWNTSNRTDENAAEDRRRNDRQNERVLASVVGGCAVANVNRITNQNMLSDLNVLRPFVPTATMDEFIAKWRAEWTPVDCRALVNDEVGVQLCLQYPPVNDPKTGLPVPTTIDPINKKACPESEPPPPEE